MIGQPFIERHFTSFIDTPIHYSEPTLSFSYTTEPLSVTVKTAIRTVKAKYCIAADGARSFVRNELGIGREGTKPNMVWAVLDCWIETTFTLGKEIVTLQVDGESRVAWIPRERGMQRFYVLLGGEITQQKAEASIRRHMVPHTVDFTHVEWFSRFEIKERIASTFTHPTPKGPIILAGDAAHVHSVNGCQGMNTGLSDAFSLLWRLYLTLKYPNLPTPSRTALISSYDVERRATAKEVIDVAAKLVRSTTAEAKYYVQLIEKNAGFITGMGLRYRELGSPLVVESEKSVFKAGYRCPDLWLDDEKREAVRLYQKLVYGRYILLLVGEASLAEVHVGRSDFLTVLRLVPLKAMSVGAERSKDTLEEEQVHATAFGCSWVKQDDNYAALVRPDCYVEFVGDADQVVRHLQNWFPDILYLSSGTDQTPP